MRKKENTEGKRAGTERATADLKTIEELLKDQQELGLTKTVYEPSEEAVIRLTAIPLLFGEPRGVATGIGSVAYDSWSDGPSIALRNITDGHIRRLRLQAGKIAVEIVGEMSKGRWEFVARAYRGATVVHDYVLNVGRKRLLSESGGFFKWTSKAVPRKVVLISLRERLMFERLSW